MDHYPSRSMAPMPPPPPPPHVGGPYPGHVDAPRGWPPQPYHMHPPAPADHCVVEVVEPLPEDDGANAKPEKKKKKDKEKKEGKDDKPSEPPLPPVATSYEAYMLERADPQRGGKLSWGRVGRRLLPFDDLKLVDLVKKHRRKTGTTTTQDFAELASNQQGVINRLLAEKQVEETHPDAVWTLVDVQKYYLTRGWTKEVNKIQVVLKRHASDKAKPPPEGSSSTRRYQLDEIIDLGTAPPVKVVEVKKESKKDEKGDAEKGEAGSKKKKEHPVDEPIEHFDYYPFEPMEYYYDNPYPPDEERMWAEQQHAHHQRYAPRHHAPELQPPPMPNVMPQAAPENAYPPLPPPPPQLRASDNPFTPLDEYIPPEAPMANEFSARNPARIRTRSPEPQTLRQMQMEHDRIERDKRMENLEGEIYNLQNQVDGLDINRRPPRTPMDGRSYSPESLSTLSFSPPHTPMLVELVSPDSLQRVKESRTHWVGVRAHDEGLHRRRSDHRRARSPKRESRRLSETRRILVEPRRREPQSRPRPLAVTSPRVYELHSRGLQRRGSDGSIDLLHVDGEDSMYGDDDSYYVRLDTPGRRNRHRMFRRASERYEF